MDEPTRDGRERDRRGPSAPADGEPVREGDFYRGGVSVATRRPRRRSRSWPVGFAGGRPPLWLSGPLVLAGVLVGFLAFSTAWDLVGDGVMAVPLAALVGLGIASGTVLVGGYVWARRTSAPEPA